VNAQEYAELRESRGGVALHLGDGFMVTCPAHDDRNPSLHVSDGREGLLLHCHAGCATSDVLAADGLGWDDIRPGGGRSQVEATYDYVDEDGRLLFQSVRYHSPKRFKQRRPDGAGGWIWDLKGVRRVLYRLPQVLEAVAAGETIYIVEGEKDVRAIERAGAVATCNPMGAGKWRDEFSEVLINARVVIVADRDREGYEHVSQVAKSLEYRAITTTIVKAAAGKDVSDHLAAGHSLTELVPVSDAGGRYRDDSSSSSSSRGERLRELDVEHLLATQPEPVPYVLHPMLVEGCVTMLDGREGRGKSMVALAVSSGLGGAERLLDIAGMTVGLGGLVLYVDGENGEREVHRRLHGLDVRPGTLKYVVAEGFDLTRQFGELEQLVEQLEPRLLVLDSLRSLAPGLDENDSQQAEAALAPLRNLAQRLGIAILVLHHASRSGDYRGSTAIGAAVQIGFTLKRFDDDPMGQTRRLLHCWKHRPDTEPPDRWLTIKKGDEGKVLISEAAPYEPERPAPVRDAVEVAVWAWIEEGCQGVTTPRGPDTVTPPGWVTADACRAVGREPKDATVRRVLKRLEDSGLICRNGNGRWSRVAADDEETS
jgi:5S rRNA maturation endonuclease (ribonuclease M5)